MVAKVWMGVVLPLHLNMILWLMVMDITWPIMILSSMISISGTFIYLSTIEHTRYRRFVRDNTRIRPTKDVESILPRQDGDMEVNVLPGFTVFPDTYTFVRNESLDGTGPERSKMILMLKMMSSCDQCMRWDMFDRIVVTDGMQRLIINNAVSESTDVSATVYCGDTPWWS